MATSASFLMALILFTATNQLAHSQILGLDLTGRVCCTATGNCLAGSPGIPGVTVTLNCTNLLGTSVQVGQGTTSVDGSFRISIRNILTLLGFLLNPSQPAPCTAIVRLPLNQTVCPILSTVNGTLVSALQTINIVGGLLGRILQVSLLGFVNLSI